jgi:hypothetical protein
MVTGWIVSITLFAVCGLVALAIVKIIDDLDRTTSIAEDVEAEVRSPYDTDGQGLQALVGDEETKIPIIALAGAIANNVGGDGTRVRPPGLCRRRRRPVSRGPVLYPELRDC